MVSKIKRTISPHTTRMIPIFPNLLMRKLAIMPV